MALFAVGLGGCGHGAKSSSPAPTAGALAAAPSAGATTRVVLVAGGGTGGEGALAKDVQLAEPFAVALAPDGTLFIAEHGGNRIRRIDKKGIATTLAGTGGKGLSGDGGPATQAMFNGPHHLVFPPGGGDLFVADTFNNCVRRIDLRTGVVSRFAGTGEKAFGGDGGPALEARFSGIFSIAFDARGERLYITDLGNRRIRAIDMKTGVVTTVAGNGEKGEPADGAVATSAPLMDPRASLIDSKGNLYILERNGHALRVVDPQGKIRTVAGTGQAGGGGDGGPARAAVFRGPKHIGLDHEDNILITDTENHVIRKYVPREEKVVHVAGSGQAGPGGLDGPANLIQLNRPHGAFEEPDGSLLISDSENHRIVRLLLTP